MDIDDVKEDKDYDVDEDDIGSEEILIKDNDISMIITTDIINKSTRVYLLHSNKLVDCNLSVNVCALI
jgi:hypothetical protein